MSQQHEIVRIWNDLSDYWSQNFADKDVLKSEIFDSFVLKSIKREKPQVVIDAGCGEGHLSRKISPLVKIVTAIDLAEQMISLAKIKSTGFKNVTFYTEDCGRIKHITDNSADMVIGAMLINSVANLKRVLSEFNRVLKSRGTLILSFFHPCFVIPGESGWIYNQENLPQKLIKDYFNEGLKRFHLNNKETLTYHRSLTTM